MKTIALAMSNEREIEIAQVATIARLREGDRHHKTSGPHRGGMLGGEIGWTLEDNVLVNRAVETFGGHLDRRYRMFGIDLR